jgi:two-component system, NtrC family, C4-dicarboxylate transport sensor histidine kinase DctB
MAGRLRRSVLVLSVVLAALAAALVWQIAYSAARSGIEARLDQNLVLTGRTIESEIERFRYLPLVLGEDARIRALIANADTSKVTAANAYLETVAAQSGAAQLFVLNEAGTAMATSNWNTPDDLTGNTYDFRPYFRAAMAGGQGRYYAIGVTTGKPGYFLSFRVDHGGRAGVVVVKVDLRGLEDTWRQAGVATAIADRDGVVFLTGIADWAYRPLRPLAEDVRARIASERTYEGVDVAGAAPLGAALPGAHGHLLTRARALEPDGWTLLAAADPTEARGTAALWAVGAALLTLALSAVGHVIWQRRQILRLRLNQREMLERRVTARTRELAQEIEARIRTEAELRAAQQGLIHAEKMAALGRMSAAIVHEISQPLTAMETTLASAGLAAEKAGVPRVGERLTRARGLIKRMQRTIRHLKTFSRKDSAVLERVEIDDVIRNTLELAHPRARALSVDPGFSPEGHSPAVHAVALRLEQVLLNLLLNALDAVVGLDRPVIAISRAVEGATVVIRVTDNGTGIPPDVLPRMTEPFFSTKIAGEGLGLGLSISAAIVEEFGGSMAFDPGPGGGTVATLRLPVMAQAQEAAE